MAKLEPAGLGTRVLIIGAGAAGLRTAIELATAGVECLVVGKRGHGDAHTRWAAGGINAVLGSLDPDDKWEIHAADTFREGHRICDPVAVELLAREAPERVRELHAWGCAFDLTSDGRINQRYFGAQSYRRTCFVGDRTGEAILETLVQHAEQLNVSWMEGVFVTDLVQAGRRVCGALALDLQSGKPIFLRAEATVLATGGHTSAYSRSSSRPDENTGDSAALALEAGAVLRDMEFVQFHPTGWVYPESMRGRLVTEAVRGEGGHLINAGGERFMQRYSPEHMELDARDVVARAIFEEIREGRATTHDGVLLDISHREPQFIDERLPRVRQQFLDHGVDITRQPMEVAPTAHYAMGGVAVNFENGATRVPSLFAVGEATGGLHGANRLGGNSLAETLVFGRRVGAYLARYRSPAPTPFAAAESARRALSRLRTQLGRRKGENPRQVAEELRGVLWQHGGIVRSAEELGRGLRKLRDLAKLAERAALASSAAREEIELALGLRGMTAAATAILSAALMREESRGAHHRSDCPVEREAWRKTILCERGRDGALAHSTKDIPPAPREILAELDRHSGVDYHLLE